jgi:hypothetical protein
MKSPAWRDFTGRAAMKDSGDKSYDNLRVSFQDDPLMAIDNSRMESSQQSCELSHIVGCLA